MSYKIALNFEDGATRFIDCLPGEQVADVAYRHGINIPLDCREGACGTCKSFCESGRFSMTDYIDDALSAQEAEAGYVLTCKMKAASDCVLRIPASSTVCKAGAGTALTARIGRIEQLSPSAILLAIEHDALNSMQFLPGQYANLTIPGSEESRAYSFSSLAENGQVSFLIRNVPEGRMSSYLTTQAKVGGEIGLQAPYGSFYLRPIERPLLMVAGGTGLAPFLSMLESIRKAGSAHPIHLVYGVTKDEDLIATEQLDDFTRAVDGFSYTACVAATEVPERKRGLVTDYLEPSAFRGGEVDVYLCGPPPMVNAVEAFMKDQGLQPAHLYFERFLPSR